MTSRPGLRPIAKLSSGWTLCTDVSHPGARPYFVRGSLVRTVHEAARLPEGRSLFRDVHRLWKQDRREYRGPWREDAVWRAIDYARDGMLLMLQFIRRWSPDLLEVA